MYSVGYRLASTRFALELYGVRVVTETGDDGDGGGNNAEVTSEVTRSSIEVVVSISEVVVFVSTVIGLNEVFFVFV
jgi:hypothetical protein